MRRIKLLTSDEKRRLRDAYRVHQIHARQRGIRFDFDYGGWLDTWMDSGRLQERGRGKGFYVMARFGDAGPYAPGNVGIIPMELNSSLGTAGAKNGRAKLTERDVRAIRRLHSIGRY